MLTAKMLDDMPPGTVFATGVAADEPGGLFMANTGRMLRWVAVRGSGIADWTIYCHFAEHDVDWIKRQGDKVCNESHIRNCVECDEVAFSRYRY